MADIPKKPVCSIRLITKLRVYISSMLQELIFAFCLLVKTNKFRVTSFEVD